MKRLWVIMCIAMISGYVCASETDPLWEKYIKARITYYTDLAELAIRAHPEFREMFELTRDIRVTSTKLRQRRYYYLLNYDPGRIRRNEGAVQWADLDWTAEDNKLIRDKDPKYLELLNILRDLNRQSARHPDWANAHLASAGLMRTAEYKNIFNAFWHTTIAEIDQELKNSR